MTLEQIISTGNMARLVADVEANLRKRAAMPSKQIRCADGFTMSVIAGCGTYCTPRPDWFNDVPADYAGPYTEVEVGYPSERPEPWEVWSEYAEVAFAPTETIYSFVPVELVRQLVAAHGGEA